ncbi:S1C family serine protease [Ferrovibrio sp.]|jgi:serine protease Do|uniref:S1C family serine protease n=1 Tax=Ferrovibrio sp. TaxID=1917215 RepID=UPI0035AF4584
MQKPVSLFVGIGLVLAACVNQEPLAPPVIVATSVALPDGTQVTPTSAGPETRVVGLQRVQFDVPRGSEIGVIRKLPFTVCEGGNLGRIFHDEGRFLSRSKEWQDIFHRIVTGHGYRAAGAPDSLFSEQGRDDAEYLFGANIRATRTEAVLVCDFIDAHIIGITGNSTISVEWQIFDPVNRRVVHKATIDGRYQTTATIPADPVLLVQSAFADSVNKLAADPAVRAVVSQRPLRDMAPQKGIVSADGRRPLARQPLSQVAIDAHIDRLRSATVLIESGDASHGSGFIVSEDGLVITNQHVVSGQRFVRVRLVSGRAVIGEVLRRQDIRDVALIKLEGRGYPAMPIRETPVRVAEEVYAIGAPQMTALAWTVTRGVVSAYRPAMPPERLDMIQADVPIHGGNSGGPLLDRQGNVVGITVAGYAMGKEQRNAGLNLFIPILDGLDKLGLELADPAAYERWRRTAALE